MGRTYAGPAAVAYWCRRAKQKPPRPLFWLEDADGEFEATLHAEDPDDWQRIQQVLQEHPERLRCMAPGPDGQHDTVLRLRLPRSLAAEVKNQAEADGVSMSHLVRSALEERMTRGPHERVFKEGL